jgi:hypothetical protein
VPWNSSPLAFPENKTYDERSHFTVSAAKRPWEKTTVEVEPCLAVLAFVSSVFSSCPVTRSSLTW